MSFNRFSMSFNRAWELFRELDIFFPNSTHSPPTTHTNSKFPWKSFITHHRPSFTPFPPRLTSERPTETQKRKQEYESISKHVLGTHFLWKHILWEHILWEHFLQKHILQNTSYKNTYDKTCLMKHFLHKHVLQNTSYEITSYMKPWSFK